MTLQQPALPATATLVRPTRRRDRARLFQEIGMLAPAVMLLTIFLVVPFLLSFWTAMTNQPLVPRGSPSGSSRFNAAWPLRPRCCCTRSCHCGMSSAACSFCPPSPQ